MKLLVYGAGAGGAAAAVELSHAGHEVVLYARSAATLVPFQLVGIGYRGVLGEGAVWPSRMTADLCSAIAGAEAAVIVLPTTAHVGAAHALASAGWGSARPVVLNPGHTGGALEFAATYRAAGLDAPPIAELSTLSYVARKLSPGVVTVTGRAKSLRAAALPGGQPALDLACRLFPGTVATSDVLASGLANVNMVLHPPGAVLAAAWVEARRGDFTFYGDAMTPGVARVMRALDGERRRVAIAFGHVLPSLIGEMKLIGTVEPDAPDEDYAAAIAGGRANRRIVAPDTLQHRYYAEDFGHGLTPFMAFAQIAGVDVPVASALSRLGEELMGPRAEPVRDSVSMGINRFGADQLLRAVRH